MARRSTGSLWLGRLLDVVAYAAAVTGTVVVVAGVPSFLLGLNWVGVKWILFLLGWIAFGYGTFTLRPTPPWKRDDPAAPDQQVVGSRTETRFQAAVQRLPPARFHPVEVDERLPVGVKVFLASLAMLGTSLAMEFAFGVGVA